MGVNIKGKTTKAATAKEEIVKNSTGNLSSEEVATINDMSDKEFIISSYYAVKANINGLAEVFGVRSDKTLIEISKDFLELRCTKQHIKPDSEKEEHEKEVHKLGKILVVVLNTTYGLGPEYNKIYNEVLNNPNYDKTIIINFIEKLTKLVNESDKDIIAHFVEKFENNSDEVLINKILQENGLEPIVLDTDVVKPETLSESERLIKEAESLINGINKEVDDTVKTITEDVNKIIEENISSVNNINTSVSSGDSSDSSSVWKYVMYGLAAAAVGYGLYKAYEYYTDDSYDDVVILSDADMFDFCSADF